MALSVTFLFVYEISPEPLNGFAPYLQVRRVWSLAQTSLNAKVKKSKVKVTRDKNRCYRRISPISGTDERIWDKFTRKTCLIPRSNEFEGQGQLRWPECGLCLENIFAVFCQGLQNSYCLLELWQPKL